MDPLPKIKKLITGWVRIQTNPACLKAHISSSSRDPASLSCLSSSLVSPNTHDLLLPLRSAVFSGGRVSDNLSQHGTDPPLVFWASMRGCSQ